LGAISGAASIGFSFKFYSDRKKREDEEEPSSNGKAEKA
jgi:hypothetical protein